MKKRSTLIMMFCGIWLLFALGGCNNEQNPTNPSTLTVGEYFPILNDTRYVYEGTGNEYASYDVYNDYTSESRVQQRINNGGTALAQVISMEDGKVIRVFSSEEIYHREDYLHKTGSNEVLLAEPIAMGTTWTLGDGRTRTITNTSVAVSTPSGEYEAIEVTTDGEDGTTIQYYAKNVGLIKTVYRAGANEISSVLYLIEKDVPLTQTLRFFYPNEDGTAVYYEDRTIDFRTNDSSKDIITKAYQEAPAGTAKVFSENTAVNSLSRGDDGIVYLDLNQAFLTDMNAGADYERMLLSCIANTFSYYYNTDKVVLTIDGSPYSSGQITLPAGEYLQADFSDMVQL